MTAKPKPVAKVQPVDAEMAQFQADLLQSIRELKAGQFARVTHVPTIAYVKNLDQKDQMSLNQFVTVNMAEKMSALQTPEFFTQRAASAKKGDLTRLLLQVKARQPLAGDELPQ